MGIHPDTDLSAHPTSNARRKKITQSDDCEDACKDNNTGRHWAGDYALSREPNRLGFVFSSNCAGILVIIQVAALVAIPEAVPVFVLLVPVCIALSDSRVIEVPIAAAELSSRHAARLALAGFQSPMSR